ncbi:pyridoxal phosphate-dependent aminotransferase [Carnobacterium gallinarum]|uniref:pyridoxal phosphate-dependent aminotransferase n=1 Tax=Carnobacterium gallinarum TaxID=2749 RepID=UPI00054EFBB1|nr:pyridoxal phosphate-dependent aminotransferase [Carnobacterium gallinarum]
MDYKKLAKHHQVASLNILADIGTLAKNTPNLIDLSIGDPDLITDDRIIQQAFLDVKNGHTKYTESGGSADLIESILSFYQRFYQLSFEKDQVRATVGALHGMYLTLQTILDAGDEVIIHEPYFSPYKDQVVNSGGVPVFIPTYEKDGFAIDIAVLEAAITNKTKALILNSPNNPTGAVFSQETFKQIAELAKKYDFFILSDEVYDGFSFYDEFVPMATYAPDHTVTFGSLSKNFSMTGWRIGYMVAPSYLNAAAKLLNEGITYSAPTPSQRAAIYALDHAEELIPKVSEVFKERLEYVAQRVAEIPYLSLHPLKGSIYAFINISKTGMDSMAFSQYVLQETQVLVIPGLAFGESGDRYVRLAATQNREILTEAFNRLAQLTFD